MFSNQAVVADRYFLGGEEAFSGSVCAGQDGAASRWMAPGRDELRDRENISNGIKHTLTVCLHLIMCICHNIEILKRFYVLNLIPLVDNMFF